MTSSDDDIVRKREVCAEMLTEERKTELRDNYLRVLERIEEARLRRGGGEPVTLLAATKPSPRRRCSSSSGSAG